MNTKRQYGFTLVELLLGIVAAAILALTAGAILVNGYRGWQRAQRMAEVRRDTTVALRALDWTLRPAGYVSITNAAGAVELRYRRPDLSWGVVRQSGSTLERDGAGVVSTLLNPGGFAASVTGKVVTLTVRVACPTDATLSNVASTVIALRN